MRHHVVKEVNTFGRHDGEHNYKRFLKIEFADHLPRQIARRRPIKICTGSFVLPLRRPLFREGLLALNVIQALLVLLMSWKDLPHGSFQTRFL